MILLLISEPAGIGDFTILASKQTSKGRILSFEMNINHFKLLKKNIKLNKNKNIFVFNKKVKSLSNLFKEHNVQYCNFLKIDCEGCEYEIFKNISLQTLSKINYIAMEIHLFNPIMKNRYKHLKSLLKNNNFKIKEINNPVHNYLKFLFAWQKKP